MNGSEVIYIELSVNDQQLLSENQVDIRDILSLEGIDAEVKSGIAPDLENTGIRTKDVATIVMASAGLVLAIGSAISNVLRTLQNRPRVVEYFDLIECESDHSDNNSQPKFKRVKRYELLQPTPSNEKSLAELSLTREKGVVIKFGTELSK